MLNAKWKSGGAAAGPTHPEEVRAGQIRSFKITQLDPSSKRIEVKLA
jgi:small subunit ribosomal protein S1